MSRCYAYIVAYISRLEIGNVVLRPARLEVGHYDIAIMLGGFTRSLSALVHFTLHTGAGVGSVVYIYKQCI